jgi:hypothetical protein
LLNEGEVLKMGLNITRARVTVTLEMDYISSTYMMRDHNHIEKFFQEILELKERYEDLYEDPENPQIKKIPRSVIKCEYLSNGNWVKSN